MLGGTAEARRLCELLASCGRFDVVFSLKGVTGAPRLPPARLVRGGFGGAEGLARFLAAEGIDAVVDASHPFATQISANAAAAAANAGVPLLRLLRPAWRARPGDRWTQVGSIAEAAGAIAPGQRVFVALGAQGSEAFAAAAPHAELVIRTADEVPPARRRANARYLHGPPNRSVEAEVDLLAGHSISVVVARNSGGPDGYGKIAAARRIGIPVIMIRRPREGRSERAATAEAAVGRLAAWFPDAGR